MKNTFLLWLFSISILLGQEVNIQYIDSVFQKAYNEGKFSGHVVITQENNIVYDTFFGKADYEKQLPFDKNSIFQAASISKQFTVAAILILEQQGKLQLEDNVKKHLPEFPYSEVKIIHLLNHTSGMPDFQKTMIKDLDLSKTNGNQELLQLLKSGKYPQQWQAGSKWDYSDIAYCTAALIIERVGQTPFKTFMQQYIFNPAGMKNTTAEYYTDARLIKNKTICKGYEFDDQTKQRKIAYDQPHNTYVSGLAGFYGDGSVYTTGYDLLKWDAALHSETILNQKSKEKLFTATQLNNGNYAEDLEYKYGLGWYIGKNQNVGTFYFHPGGQAGYCTKFIRCPQQKTAIAILSNISHIDFYSFTNIYNHIFK